MHSPIYIIPTRLPHSPDRDTKHRKILSFKARSAGARRVALGPGSPSSGSRILGSAQGSGCRLRAWSLGLKVHGSGSSLAFCTSSGAPESKTDSYCLLVCLNLVAFCMPRNIGAALRSSRPRLHMSLPWKWRCGCRAWSLGKFMVCGPRVRHLVLGVYK